MKAVEELFETLTVEVSNHTESKLLEVTRAVSEMELRLKRLESVSSFLRFLASSQVNLSASFLSGRPMIEQQVNALISSEFTYSLSSFQDAFNYNLRILSTDLASGKDMVISTIKAAELLKDDEILRRRDHSSRIDSASAPSPSSTPFPPTPSSGQPIPSPQSPTPDLPSVQGHQTSGLYLPNVALVQRQRGPSSDSNPNVSTETTSWDRK